MGHIDSGKTTFLDKIKGTCITDKEPGKITQHIGATEITYNTIIHSCDHLLKKFKFDLNEVVGLAKLNTKEVFDLLRLEKGTIKGTIIKNENDRIQW
jgi:translation initiation factor 5B